MTTSLALCVLAAGKGTRMRSSLPKVLHEVAGLPLLGHALKPALASGAERAVIVTGHQSERVATVARKLAPEAVCVEQSPQLGTGHAVQQAQEALNDFEGDVLILYADSPMVTQDTIESMRAERAKGAGVVVLGFEAAYPTGYGRLVTGADGSLERIVEHKEATPEELAITLCNSAVMCVDRATLFDLLSKVNNDNAKGEYYLTDIVGLARNAGQRCSVVVCDEAETLGVNSRTDLAAAEAAFQGRERAILLEKGVTMQSPETVFLSHDTEIENDVIVEPHVVFGPGAKIETGARIRAFSHIEGATIAADAVIGPYARLRPGAEIGEGARIGNFVEVKNAQFGKGAKANHLTYVGDASVGSGANIGAGTITCNYDGYNKHKTEIGEAAFIGSNSALVAPVKIGERAIVGAGSVITMEVEPDALALARGRQANKPGLAERIRETLADLKAKRKSEGTV